MLTQTGVEETSEETLSVSNDLTQTEPEKRALVLEVCAQTEQISLSDNHVSTAVLHEEVLESSIGKYLQVISTIEHEFRMENARY